MLEWEGRNLISIRECDFWDDGDSYDCYSEYTFTYNADGIRTSKNVDGTVYEYILNGSQILGQKWTDGSVEYLMLFIYDETGSPVGIRYRTSDYAASVFDSFFFEKNLQGDIVAVYNSAGTKIGTYTYDAWGACSKTQITSGVTAVERLIVFLYNPFRYRGYYYDRDIGMYYLQSRYYNPDWGRFLYADAYISTGTGLLGYNMFAYCNNNPVMNVDPTGHFPWLVLLLITALPVVLSGCSGVSLSHNPGYTKIDEKTGYETYDEAVDKANSIVYELGSSHSGQIDAKGKYSEYGFEYTIGIYYNHKSKMFYMTDPYTDNLMVEVGYREIIDSEAKYEIIGYAHYHPRIGDMGIQFSDGDKKLADAYNIAIHVISATGETNSSYSYVSWNKWRLINP